ncbi:hypothetical protein ACJJTC_014944 [Scirpophaga incertulas]
MIEGPGSTKPADIATNQLKFLKFVVQGLGQTRRRYSYWSAHNITKDPRINLKRKTMLLALGYLDSTNFPISAMLANEYEARGYNVIMVDYQRFATVHYYLAARLMRPIGKLIAQVLVHLTNSGLDPSKLELLGFSLGGQTVSYIARNYQALTGRNISKLTALEPSGPCFRDLRPTERLDASNADFVEVVHTNIDGYGMAPRMGHVDFYVNGGEYQPSDLLLYPCTSTCSHFRVLPLWVSSLKNPTEFVAIKCDNIQQARDSKCYDRSPLETNVMGLRVNRSNHGIFYLSTTKSWPYYLGASGVRPEYASWKRISDVNKGDDVVIYT